MTALAWPAASRRLERAASGTAVVGVTILAGAVVTTGLGMRLILAAGASLLLGALGFIAPRRVLAALVVWLAALGLLRRLLSEIAPPGAADPLLIVGPVAIVVLAMVAAKRGALQAPTRLSTAVLALTALVLLGALNPLQGDVLVGLSALLFLLVPLLGFWIGRGLCDDTTLGRVLKLVAVLALPVAAYGLGQTFLGFPSWDQTWIETSGYAALSVGGVTRAFGTFSSAAEYAHYLAIAALAWVLFWVRPGRLPLTFSAVALLLLALFFESSRGIVLMLIFAIGLVLGARRGLRLTRSGVVGVILAMLLVFSLANWAPRSFGPQSTAVLVEHQLRGLSDPLDPESSTLLAHATLVADGVRSIIDAPLGHGIGAVTLAGSKFGETTRSTEADPSNMAVALGLPGLVAYVVVFLLGFRTIYSVASVRRDPLALAALGVVAITAFNWLNGGQYAVALLPWLALGWADRWHADRIGARVEEGRA